MLQTQKVLPCCCCWAACWACCWANCCACCCAAAWWACCCTWAAWRIWGDASPGKAGWSRDDAAARFKISWNLCNQGRILRNMITEYFLKAYLIYLMWFLYTILTCTPTADAVGYACPIECDDGGGRYEARPGWWVGGGDMYWGGWSPCPWLAWWPCDMVFVVNLYF